ncbi:hypothetical protein CWE04_11710 [Thomasclavelia cocleata]|uniref:Cro/C1-type HTH DNA-binding domain-containing protein n=1 Tax=Thomasclavelia cocleata TaxID=69824 RepID=A0A1I0BIN4_9FIRM|nr:hypothetical protein [Thomasclavelia cocleata]MCR1960230.1 hypothetical protein [Thomasclavelia cocleata]NDO41796.1 hypothetical protein [Thomasclavelia cocleata]PJN79868.1 hypothetical protein CWE04_11710 [Thomasclavelia cocleata]SET06696.1 hypothetical protein SAMN04489758_101135 [Thomasclavelia cocleata]
MSKEIIFKYNNNNQLKKTIKEIALYNDIKMSSIANNLNISNSQLTNTLNKKNINFNDIKKILDVVGYDLVLEFRPKDNFSIKNKLPDTISINTNNNMEINTDIVDDDILALLNDTIKYGYSGINVVDNWLENNGYIINSKLFDSDGKILDNARALLVKGVSFGKTNELIKKKVFIKDKKL